MKNKHTDTLKYPTDLAKIQEINATKKQSLGLGDQTIAPRALRFRAVTIFQSFSLKKKMRVHGDLLISPGMISGCMPHIDSAL